MTRPKAVSEKSPATGAGRVITSTAARFRPPPEGERRAGDDCVADAGLSHLAALGDILAFRGVKCEVNDRGAWPRLRIYGPYDIDSAVAEFDNNMVVIPRGDDWWFAWPWSETITPVTDMVTAGGPHSRRAGLGRPMSSDTNPPGGMAKPAGNDNPVTADEADQPFWDIAAQIRGEREQWVIIWLAPERRFRAYPKFRPPAGMTSANGSTRDDLLADMDRIEQAACPPRGRSSGHPASRKPGIAVSSS